MSSSWRFCDAVIAKEQRSREREESGLGLGTPLRGHQDSWRRGAKFSSPRLGLWTGRSECRCSFWFTSASAGSSTSFYGRGMGRIKMTLAEQPFRRDSERLTTKQRGISSTTVHIHGIKPRKHIETRRRHSGQPMWKNPEADPANKPRHSAFRYQARQAGHIKGIQFHKLGW